MIRELTSASSTQFEAALDAVVASTLSLRSATTNREFGRGARARAELEHELARAQELAQDLIDSRERADGLRLLGELQATATRLLVIAPAPTSAAIAAASAGDDTLWRQEEQAWITYRLAIGVRGIRAGALIERDLGVFGGRGPE